MTNAPNNRKFNGNRCPICDVKIRGYLQWLCPKHRTSEFAAQANSQRTKVTSHEYYNNGNGRCTYCDASEVASVHAVENRN